MAAKRASRKMPIHDVGPQGVTTPAPVIPIKAPTVTKEGLPGYFSRVVSNVKGRNMDVKLSRCTAIVSERNRAGKTAVLDAFRLALTGKHPIGSDAVDLVGLTADGSWPTAGIAGDVASSIFSFPDGKRTPVLVPTGEFLQLQADDVANLLPLVANRELLSLGTAKAREGLFRRFGSASLATATAPPMGLSPEQVVLWNRAIAGDGRLGSLDTTEKLSAAGTWIRSHKSNLGKKMKALEEEKQRLHDMAVAAGAGAPTDDLLRDIQKKIDTHRALGNTTLLRSRAQQSESRLMELIEQYKVAPKPIDPISHEQALQEIREKYPVDEMRAAVEKGQPAVDAAQRNVRLFTVLVGIRKNTHSTGTCLACTEAQGAGPAASLVTGAEQALADAKAQALSLSAALEQDQMLLQDALNGRNRETVELDGTLARERNAYERLLADLKAAKANYEASQSMLAEAGVGEIPAEPLEVLQQQLTALNNAKAESGRATGLAVELRSLQQEQEDTKTVEKSLGKVLNDLVASVQTAAQDAVNAWMPPGFKAALMLEDEDGKPTCRWEIIGTDGRPHPRGAASGAEWAALTVAVACAWSEGQRFRFLLLDDADLAGFSAENVRKALTMIAEAVASGRLTQALVAWSRPMEIPDEGWSVVSL